MREKSEVSVAKTALVIGVAFNAWLAEIEVIIARVFLPGECRCLIDPEGQHNELRLDGSRCNADVLGLLELECELLVGGVVLGLEAPVSQQLLMTDCEFLACIFLALAQDNELLAPELGNIGRP